jgi:Zn-dependent peptidase ImmA (M78 family)
LRTPSPEQAAQEARASLGIGPIGPISDLLVVIESAADIPVTLLPLPSSVAGALGKKEGHAYIFVNSDHWPVRRRFTLAHEFGHYFLNHTGHIDTVSTLNAGVGPQEAVANRFAAEFLAPIEAVHSWRKSLSEPVDSLEAAVRLAIFFRISATAAVYRLKSAEILSPRACKRLLGRIGFREHLDLAETLGLTESPDSVSAVGRNAWRYPSQMVANGVKGTQRGGIHPKKLAQALQISVDNVEEMLDTWRRKQGSAGGSETTAALEPATNSSSTWL